MKIAMRLLKSMVLAEFPSGSSINYLNGKLYLIGDDANHILVLDHDYQKIDSIHLFDRPEKRIPKNEKADLETSTWISVDGRSCLLIFGSSSRQKRQKTILIPAPAGMEAQKPDFDFFDGENLARQLENSGIGEVNIEGSTILGDALVLANRGNENNPRNHLIFLNKDFHESRQPRATISRLGLPPVAQHFLGVSELCYAEELDILFVTLSSESTPDSYSDGAIGSSFLGWAVKPMAETTEIFLDGLTDLSTIHEAFRKQKIEGICLERAGPGEAIAHLISDNDRGESSLFKMSLRMEEADS